LPSPADVSRGASDQVAGERIGAYIDQKVLDALGRRDPVMLWWALIFLIIAGVAALFGFTGIAAAAAGVAKILFIIFLVIFLVFLVLALLGIGAAT
jgi:uncharacterized membrane protein YtjA (UPF0391 family)